MQSHSLTIAEVKSLILNKFEEMRMISSKHYSQQISKIFRDFINLCTSISIKLMQYHLLSDTLDVLIKVSEADKLLCDLGSLYDRC